MEKELTNWLEDNLNNIKGYKLRYFILLKVLQNVLKENIELEKNILELEGGIK